MLIYVDIDGTIVIVVMVMKMQYQLRKTLIKLINCMIMVMLLYIGHQEVEKLVLIGVN